MKKLNLENILNKLVIIFLLLSFVSCKSLKNKINEFDNCNELVNYFSNKNDNISKICIKQNITSLIRFNSNEFKVECRIQYLFDSCIMINILSKTMGIEISRAKIFKDSIIFIDRLNKKYYQGLICNFNAIDNSLLDLKLLKNVLLGQYLFSKNDSISSDDNKINLMNESLLSLSDSYSINKNELKIYYSINNKGQIEKVKIVNEKNNYFLVSINNFKFSTLFDIPINSKIEFNDVDSKVEIDILNSKVEKIDNFNTTIKIPDNYTLYNKK
jgi:hypothetical protein